MMLIVRLLDQHGVYYPRTHCLGEVEIRNPRTDTASERAGLAESCRLFEESLSEQSMRVVTVVHDSTSVLEADAVAEERFEEALDVVASEAYGMSRPSLLPMGVIVDPRSGIASPRRPDPRDRPMFGAKVVREQFMRCDWPQFLLSARQLELAQRLIRSYHWSRKALLEANGQLRVLFRWFAMEAIWMLGKKDDIVPRVMWSLGFPNGDGAALVSPALIQQLASHKTSRAWRGQVEDRLAAVRTFRHNSVHSGFRAQDIPRALLREFDEITTLACPRVQACARAGVLAGIGTAAELFEYLPLVVESDANYVNDAHNNVIFRVENALP